MIRIIVTDDHILIREGFRKIIEREPGMEVTDEAGSAAELFSLLKNKEIDMLILDINLPDRNGIDVLKDVRSRYPKLPVLMLSMFPEERFAKRALKAGASGYITKESAPDTLIAAIQQVSCGRKYISENLAQELAFSFEQGQENIVKHETLSDREFQIMINIGEGLSVNEISEELSISKNTVNTYRSRIMEKMSWKSNAEIIHYVIRNKLID